MKSRVTKCAILAIALVAVASCGGSSSDEAGTPTTGASVEVLDTTTSSIGSNTDTEVTTATTVTATTAPAGTLPQKGSAVTPTTILQVAAAAVVTDPGNFQATYLASNNALGAPRPTLPAEASLATNASRAVSASLSTDSVLTVTNAEWVGTTTPMTLRWTISTTSSGSLVCDNCAFLTTRAKTIIKEVTSQTLKGSGIKSIRGLDPTSSRVGAFLGNGWGAEFILADQSNDSAATGNAIRDFLLSCTGTTASTCKNVALKVAELKWKNTLWSTSDCISALRNGGPSQFIDGITTALTGANADTAAFIRSQAALDRVAVATPAYRPVFNTSGTTRTLTGFASTGCAS